jgi:hypothetical protein
MGVGLGRCSAEDIVRLKHDTETTLSYSSLAKRAGIMRFAPPCSLARIRWTALAEKMFGEPCTDGSFAIARSPRSST